jgi:hypothetical protein
MGRNPKCAKLVAAEESSARAVVNVVCKMASADMERLPGAVAFGFSIVRSWLAGEVWINLNGVILQFGDTLPPTPLGRRAFLFRHVDALDILALHKCECVEQNNGLDWLRAAVVRPFDEHKTLVSNQRTGLIKKPVAVALQPGYSVSIRVEARHGT